jgi:hypothetical protein
LKDVFDVDDEYDEYDTFEEMYESEIEGYTELYDDNSDDDDYQFLPRLTGQKETYRHKRSAAPLVGDVHWQQQDRTMNTDDVIFDEDNTTTMKRKLYKQKAKRETLKKRKQTAKKAKKLAKVSR